MSVDTLSISKRLQAKGEKPDLADEIAAILREQQYPADLVTKKDLATEIAALRSDMKAEIATLRSEMKADFATKTEMRAALAELRSEVRAWLLVQIGAILAGVTLITRL